MRLYFIPNRRFWQVLFIVLVLLFVVAPVAAQDTGGGNTDPIVAQFGLFFAAAAAVNRFVEFTKPRVNATKWSDEAKGAALTFTAVTAGIATSFLGHLNLAVSYAAVPELAGVVFTGAVLGIGADFLHVALDLVYGWRDSLRPAKAA